MAALVSSVTGGREGGFGGQESRFMGKKYPTVVTFGG
jgi:hypothetical protein